MEAPLEPALAACRGASDRRSRSAGRAQLGGRRGLGDALVRGSVRLLSRARGRRSGARGDRALLGLRLQRAGARLPPGPDGGVRPAGRGGDRAGDGRGRGLRRAVHPQPGVRARRRGARQLLLGARRGDRQRPLRHRRADARPRRPRAGADDRRQGHAGASRSPAVARARRPCRTSCAPRARSTPKRRRELCRQGLAVAERARRRPGHRVDAPRRRAVPAAGAADHRQAGAARAAAHRLGQQQHPGELQRRHLAADLLARGARLRAHLERDLLRLLGASDETLARYGPCSAT